MNQQPLCSVLVLNWNGAALLAECIAALEKTIYSPIEIVVVDNGSTDTSLEVLKGFPAVRVVALPENIGFAAGNNAGFKACRGDFIVTLNNDIVVEPSWLDSPMRAFVGDATLGIASCRQMNYFNRDTIDGLYHFQEPSLWFQPYGDGQKYSANPLFCRPGYVLSANGGSAIYRKSMLDAIGGFDERFFAYAEETDLSLRAFVADWKCAFFPDAVVYHRNAASFGRMPGRKRYLIERNRVWFIYKNFPAGYILFRLPWILFWEIRLLRVVLFREHTFGDYVRARLDGFRGLRQFHGERQKTVEAFSRRSRQYSRLARRKKIDFPAL